MAYKDDSNSQIIIAIGAVSGLLVIVLAIGVQAWFASEEQAELDRQFGRLQRTALVELQQNQRRNITTYRWIDRDKKIAAVPIDQAMKMLIDNKGKLPNP